MGARYKGGDDGGVPSGVDYGDAKVGACAIEGELVEASEDNRRGY